VNTVETVREQKREVRRRRGSREESHRVAFAVREGPIRRHPLSASRKLCAAVGHAGTDVGFGESACRRKFPPPFIGVLNAIAG